MAAILNNYQQTTGRRKLHSKQQKNVGTWKPEGSKKWSILELGKVVAIGTQGEPKVRALFTIGTDPVQKCASKVTTGKRH